MPSVNQIEVGEPPLHYSRSLSQTKPFSIQSPWEDSTVLPAASYCLLLQRAFYCCTSIFPTHTRSAGPSNHHRIGQQGSTILDHNLVLQSHGPSLLKHLHSMIETQLRSFSAGRFRMGAFDPPCWITPQLHDNNIFSFVPLPKSATPARIRSNTQLYDFELTEEDMSKLDSLDRGKEGATCWYPVDAD